MGGFDVVAIRGICEQYFQIQLAPQLSEIRKTQEELRSYMNDISAVAGDKCSPTTKQFEELAADVQLKASISQLDELISAKMNDLRLEIPSKDDVQSWLSADSPAASRLANVERAVRSHATKIADLKDLESAVQCKANVREVPTLAQFQRLSGSVEKKANASKVPTLMQFNELQEVVDKKASSDWVATVTQLEELASKVEKKANASSVPTAADLKHLQEQLDTKADTEEVATRSWVECALCTKADADQVPQNVEQLASVMERKLAFLAAKVQKNSDQVETFLNQTMVCYIPTTTPTNAPCGQWSRLETPPSTPTNTWTAAPDGLGPVCWMQAPNQCQGILQSGSP